MATSPIEQNKNGRPIDHTLRNLNGAYGNGAGDGLPEALAPAIENIKKKLHAYLTEELETVLADSVSKLPKNGMAEIDTRHVSQDPEALEPPPSATAFSDEAKTEVLEISTVMMQEMKQKEAEAAEARAAHMVLAKGTWDFIRQALRLPRKAEAQKPVSEAATASLEEPKAEPLPPLEAKDVHVYKGKVRISVRTPGGTANAMRFVQQVSAMPELRVLRLTAARSEKLDILVGLREPVRLEKKLRAVEEVAVVQNAPDQLPDAQEGHIEVYLRAPLAVALGSVPNHENVNEGRSNAPVAE
ncbi:MAG: hypothetical protein FJ317_02680 [SAR202 cluster bacterium]|nr:hypothetical protein [SAR202 cluster bacterium]